MLLSELLPLLNNHFPLSYQESYDNSGLQVGDASAKVQSVLLALDVVEETVEEAITLGCDLIISHHPVIFSPLKTISGKTVPQKIVAKAIKNDIAIYSIHTNFDNMYDGVSFILGEKIGLQNMEVLKKKTETLRKLVTFVPEKNASQLKKALFKAGCGNIGNYDSCSFSTKGVGTFRALDNATPYVGEKNVLHSENETKIEMIFRAEKQSYILTTLFENHPYEEVAYDIYKLQNEDSKVGLGAIGNLEKEIEYTDFLQEIKQKLFLSCIKHSHFDRKIKTVAVCGGSGATFISDAISSQADAYITSDCKYHDFFITNNSLLLADIGHFESEISCLEGISKKLKEISNKFAVFFSEKTENPVKYY